MNILFRALILGLICQASVSASTVTPIKDNAKLEQTWREFLTSNTQPNARVTFPYEKCFKQASNKHNVPVALLLAVARGESDFNSRAISKANAYGVMQIQWPGTAKDVGITRKADLFKPCINIHGGAKYLRWLLDRYDQNTYLAVAAYNYGPGRIKKTDSHRTIPKGAKWYARYIHQHLQHVASSQPGNQQALPRRNTTKIQYAQEQKIDILIFHRVYRAEAFVEYLRRQQPGLNLAWFRKPLGEFHVVLQYQSEKEKRKGLKWLKGLGFNLS